jgi:hypothetical protein
MKEAVIIPTLVLASVEVAADVEIHRSSIRVAILPTVGTVTMAILTIKSSATLWLADGILNWLQATLASLELSIGQL